MPHPPRPGHADLAGMQKYGFDDIRPVLNGPAFAKPGCTRRTGRSCPQFPGPGRRIETVSYVVEPGAAVSNNDTG